MTSFMQTLDCHSDREFYSKRRKESLHSNYYSYFSAAQGKCIYVIYPYMHHMQQERGMDSAARHLRVNPISHSLKMSSLQESTLGNAFGIPERTHA